MEVYSFGLLCLWALLGDVLSQSSVCLDRCQGDDNQTTIGLSSTLRTLAMLKKINKLQDAARKVLNAEKNCARAAI